MHWLAEGILFVRKTNTDPEIFAITSGKQVSVSVAFHDNFDEVYEPQYIQRTTINLLSVLIFPSKFLPEV